MTEDKLIAVIDYRDGQSDPSDLQHDQEKALNYYFGRKFGNEDPERSQIVMREVYSVIEWIKPYLMKIFFGGKKVMRFTPLGPDDYERSKQETDWVNHVIQQQNDGFLLFYTWFTEALICRNSYLLVYFEKRVDVTESVYEDVDEMILTLLQEEGEAEILEAEETGTSPETGLPTYKIRIRDRNEIGKVRIKALPTERVRVSNKHDSISLKDTDFVRYSEKVTISSLREVFGNDAVPDDISDESFDQDSVLEEVRNRNTAADGQAEGDPDPASREVECMTAFIRVDYDGDGIAELRRVIRVGNTILYNEVEDAVYIVGLTPTIVPHRHEGMSVADAVMDIQEIKSMLVRGYLDNIYLANDGRYFVDDVRVDLDDMLTSRPGGIVRVEGGVANAVQPFQHPVLGSTVVQAIEYMDNVLENRTGASPRVLQGQTFDGNSINKTATGLNAIMSSVMARIELIARIFAETGVSELFRLIHGLSLKHMSRRQRFELRGAFVDVNPREWEKRSDMTIDIGLGMGDDAQQIQSLQMLSNAQMGLMQMGLADRESVYNTVTRMTELMGFKDVQSFWIKPTPQNQPQQPPNPDMMKIALEQQKSQSEASIKQQEVVAKAIIEKLKLESSTAAETAKIKADADRAHIDQIVKMALEMMKSDDANAGGGFEIDGATTMQEPTSMAGEIASQLAAQQQPKPRRVKHVYDNNGRIVESVAVE